MLALAPEPACREAAWQILADRHSQAWVSHGSMVIFKHPMVTCMAGIAVSCFSLSGKIPFQVSSTCLLGPLSLHKSDPTPPVPALWLVWGEVCLQMCVLVCAHTKRLGSTWAWKIV